MLEAVEKAGVFHGYLEDLVYTPKTLKALQSVKNGALGKVLWARSRETHPGPHSDWFWNKELSGGGAIVDMGCHCIEIARSFIGKDIRPVEVVCWADTQVHPIEAEDSAVGLVRYENGAIGQFEVSWTFRGGMDLRDEVSGTRGHDLAQPLAAHRLRHVHGRRPGRLRGRKGRGRNRLAVPGRRRGRLAGLHSTCSPTCSNAVEQGGPPTETFYDGYVVNAIMDACYRSAQTKQWEPVQLDRLARRIGDSAEGNR